MSVGARQWLPVLLPVALLALAGPADAADFERLAAGVRSDDVRAVAFDRSGGRLAAGDAGGVVLGRPDAVLQRVLRRGPVHALAFLPAGVDPGLPLLAATEHGLHRIGAAGEVALLDVGPGELARRSVDLAVAARAVVVATDAGAFASADARRWTRLAGSFPSGPVSAVALRGEGADLECWAVASGDLWRASLRPHASGFVAGDAERVRVPFASGAGDPVDVRLDLPGADAVVLYPDAVALRLEGRPDWEVLRPGLPPGASAVRLVAALGRLWIGSDRGLLESEVPAGPWRRAAAPAGSAAVRDLVGDGEILYAATERGLLTAVAAAPVPAAAPVRRTPEPTPGPSIQQVQLAALSYLRLQPAHFDDLRRGAARRGWLPILDFDLVAQRDQGRALDFDESFVSGDTRFLIDRGQDFSRQLDVGIRLSWDLGETAFNPEVLDVSREARAVIALRDDVLDEITQLYFERERVLAELVQLPDRSSSEALRLRLRAEELAAGIDAWTGGWFSRHAPPLPP